MSLYHVSESEHHRGCCFADALMSQQVLAMRLSDRYLVLVTLLRACVCCVCECHLWLAVGDRELIQQVLFDAVITAPLRAYWTGLALNKSE